MPDLADTRPSILASVTEIIAAHLANNVVPVPDVPGFIRSVYATLSDLEGHAPAAAADMMRPAPAVPVEQSVQDEYIVCLEDGRKLRMLKRYLMAQYGLTPEAYRERWNLPRSYPMVAPAVSEQRRTSARATGLGKGAGDRVVAGRPAAGTRVAKGRGGTGKTGVARERPQSGRTSRARSPDKHA